MDDAASAPVIVARRQLELLGLVSQPGGSTNLAAAALGMSDALPGDPPSVLPPAQAVRLLTRPHAVAGPVAL